MQPDDISCGPTSCVMVLKYYGKKISITDAKKSGKTTWFKYKGKDVGMTSPDYIPIIFKQFGLSVKLEKGNKNKLQHHISSGKPVVVLIRSGYQFWHYVVAIGYNKQGIFIADPTPGAIYCVLNNVFLSSWNFTGNLEGDKIPTKDVYGLLVKWADVQGNLMFVPK